jgi:hypothetical protein
MLTEHSRAFGCRSRVMAGATGRDVGPDVGDSPVEALGDQLPGRDSSPEQESASASDTYAPVRMAGQSRLRTVRTINSPESRQQLLVIELRAPEQERAQRLSWTETP